MIKDDIKESIAVKQAILEDEELLQRIEEIVDLIYNTFKNGGKLMAAGNGGSAAHAQHFTAEFVGKYDVRERRGYPALALNTNSSVITAWSNDYDFSSVFARQIETHGEEGDVFVGFSSSGNSQNIIEALKACKGVGVKTIAILGKGGGKTKGIADIEFIVPSNQTPRVQDAQTLLVHAITEEVERKMVEDEGDNA